jgi:Fungal chitosanase of glycosyl hydrolase group 75
MPFPSNKLILRIIFAVICVAICVACLAPLLVPGMIVLDSGLTAALTGRTAAAQTLFEAENNGKTIAVVSFSENPRAFAYLTGMTIDADGAPNAYGPGNCGLDDLSNAGEPGHWSALVTDTGKPNGNPLVRNGFYISTTSLQDKSKKIDEPGRFVDASQIPFFVLPPRVEKKGDARLGDYGMVINLDNGRSSPAIFADQGPPGKLGEGSVALAQALGVDTNARIGGTNEGIVYIVFPRSGSESMRSFAEIKENSTRMFQQAGGMQRIRELFRELKLK